MTDLELKNIFSRFQNLNLIFLIRDLESGLVSDNKWIRKMSDGRKILCPVSHGCDVTKGAGNYLCHEYAAEFFRIEPKQVLNFVIWWDRDVKDQHLKFLAVLRSILSERLADADAVQGVFVESGEFVVNVHVE